jgi:bacillithiol biosynthesis deacetylase BshB1
MTLDILAIGAHPDDIEIFCGGALARFQRLGARIGLLHLTRGEAGTRGTPEERAAEAAAAAATLGAIHHRILDLGDGALTDRPELRVPLIEELRRTRPEYLVTHWRSDDHPDHAATGALVKAAWYQAGIRRSIAAPLEPHRPRQILYFPSHEHPQPRFVVPLEPQDVERKFAAIRCYASQFDPARSHEPRTRISDPSFLVAIEARLRFYGSLIGAEYGEAFVTDQPLAIGNPLESLS